MALEKKGTRETILHLGSVKFGPADENTIRSLEAIAEKERLYKLSERLLYVNSWQELLADEPPPSTH